MPSTKKHYSTFTASSYTLSLKFDDSGTNISVRATLQGARSGRPSSRITVRGNKVTIINARLTHLSKKGDQEHLVARLIHHRGFDELRLHTEKPLYNGAYFLELDYILKGFSEAKYNELKALASDLANSQHIEHKDIEAFLPSKEPPDVSTSYTIEIEQP